MPETKQSWTMQSRSISLVLGSGGARGLAHIGIIRYLEESGLHIASISGCSMGALVGAFYAAGALDAYERWVKELDAFDIIGLLDFDGEGGLVEGTKLMRELAALMGGDKAIETLPIPFTAVATDIDEEKEVWLRKGSLIEAVRASIAIPMLFAPFYKEGKRLVDGGVLNPVPIAPTFGDDTDLTLAVNLGGEAAHRDLLGSPTPKEMQLLDKLKVYASKIALDNPIFHGGIFGVAGRSFDTMQANLSGMKLAAYPPDIDITIPRDLCGMLEFNRAEEIIAYGYEHARRTLRDIV
jgi:NTE family protein